MNKQERCTSSTNNLSLLVLWVTGQCNLKCRYCYAAGISNSCMDFETAKAAIDFMDNRPYKLQFAGGEPLLNLKLIERVLMYIREEKKQDIPCAIQTNATLLDEDSILLFQKYHVDIGVSLDGKPETNEYQRGRSDKAIAGILALKKHGLKINLNTVVTKQNVDKLSEVVDMAVYFANVNGIGLDIIRDCNGTGLMIEPQELVKGLTDLYHHVQKWNQILPHKLVIREIEKARYFLNHHSGFAQSCDAYCYAAAGRCFVILPKGECYPCGSLAGRKEYYMGNIQTGIHPIALCGKGYGCPSRQIVNSGDDSLDEMMQKTFLRLIQEEHS